MAAAAGVEQTDRTGRGLPDAVAVLRLRSADQRILGIATYLDSNGIGKQISKPSRADTANGIALNSMVAATAQADRHGTLERGKADALDRQRGSRRR